MKKSLKMKIMIGVFSILFIAVLVVIYISQFHMLTMKNTFFNLQEIGSENGNRINLQLRNGTRVLQNIANRIEKENIQDTESMMKQLQQTQEVYGFEQMGMIDKEGNATDTMGNKIKLTPIDASLQESQIIVENLTEEGNPKIRVIYPVEKEGTRQYVYMLIPSFENLEEEKSIFEKLGYSLLVNKNGEVLLYDDTLETFKSNTIFEMMDKNYIVSNKLIHEMQANMLQNKNGVAFFQYANTHYYLSYQKLAVQDWYIISMIPSTVVANQIDSFLTTTILVGCIGILGIVGVVFYLIISSAKRNQTLYDVAYTDEVTGIGNKNYFITQGDHILNAGIGKENLYVIYLDIDKFKVINKKYGYKVGNKILYFMANVLKEIFEEGTLYARLANDAFGILAYIHTPIDKFMKRLNQKLSKIQWEQFKLTLPITIGVYHVEESDDSITAVLDKAVIAHGKIKGDYLTTYHIYDEELEQRLVREQEIESRMEEGIENEEFELYYQPKVELKEEQVAGAEALVRWNDPVYGVISPGVFIPIFEKNRFIVKLDTYIFEHLCRDLKNWKQKKIPIPILSVNVSKEHCIDEKFIERYIKIADKYGIRPSQIEIEITESAAFENERQLVEIMKQIKEAGFRLSMDDFGTGYSSLNLLQQLPIDVLKLDSSFIRKADQNGKYKIVLADVITLAKHLQIHTVAEGVEEEQDVSFLKEVGCDMIQGYYYARPLNKKQFEDYLLQEEKKKKRPSK